MLTTPIFGGPVGLYLSRTHVLLYLCRQILLVGRIIASVSQACIAGSRFVFSISVLQTRKCEHPFKF
jgi:hypothetical protein